MKCLTGCEKSATRLAVECEALLAHLSADHRDGTGGRVMVVTAGVVSVHPADQPRAQVIVEEQLLVAAPCPVVSDQVDPELRPVGELGDEAPQLGYREIAPTRTSDRAERIRAHRAGESERPIDRAAGPGSIRG